MGRRGQSVFSVLFLNLKAMFRSILPTPFVLHWFVREKIYCHWKGINDTRNFHSLEFYGTKKYFRRMQISESNKNVLYLYPLYLDDECWLCVVCCRLLLIFWLFAPTPQFVSISPPSPATLRFCHQGKYLWASAFPCLFWCRHSLTGGHPILLGGNLFSGESRRWAPRTGHSWAGAGTDDPCWERRGV